MVTKLIEMYDRALAASLTRLGFLRCASGLYSQSEDNAVWRGLWVTFDLKDLRVCAGPNVSVFCPAASKIVDEGLSRAYGDAARFTVGKLGRPFITHPLYDHVRVLCSEDRLPSSYDIEMADQIGGAAELMVDDFSRVANRVFGQVSSMRALKDHVVSHPSGTGASIYAMALAYLLDPSISSEEIDTLAALRPSPMTRLFAMHMKAKIGVLGRAG